MEEVKRTKKTKALIVGLKSHKDYEFSVLATNSLMMSLATDRKGETHYSKAATGGIYGCWRWYIYIYSSFTSYGRDRVKRQSF